MNGLCNLSIYFTVGLDDGDAPALPPLFLTEFNLDVVSLSFTPNLDDFHDTTGKVIEKYGNQLFSSHILYQASFGLGIPKSQKIPAKFGDFNRST